MNDLAGYEIYHYGLDLPLEELPRDEARRAHDVLMEQRYRRIAQLQRFVGLEEAIRPLTEAEVQELNDWFVLHVEMRELTAEEYERELEVLGGRADLIERNKPTDRTASLAIDIGLLLGEALIAEFGHLYWMMVTQPKNDYAYQHTALTGFRGGPAKRYHVDVERLIITHAYTVAGNVNYDKNKFSKIVKSICRIA